MDRIYDLGRMFCGLVRRASEKSIMFALLTEGDLIFSTAACEPSLQQAHDEYLFSDQIISEVWCKVSLFFFPFIFLCEEVTGCITGWSFGFH